MTPKEPKKKLIKAAKPSLVDPETERQPQRDGEQAAQPDAQPERDNTAKQPLTHKQQLFVEFYLKFLNATQAAISAGYTVANAANHGMRLMRNADILAAIDRRMAERMAVIGADHTLVLTRLVQELQADISDLFDKDTGALKAVDKWPIVWRRGLVAGIDNEEIFEGSGKDRQHVGNIRKIRFSDRTRRLELFGKHTLIRAFSEKAPPGDKNNPASDIRSILAGISAGSIVPKDQD